MQNTENKQTQSFFRDDFKPVHNGRRTIIVNHPKPIYGEHVKSYQTDRLPGMTIIKMSTGIYYYRYSSTDNTSPYGWNYLHNYFKQASDGRVMISEEQLLNIQYEISKHLADIKFLAKENRFKDISIAVSVFKGCYLAIISLASKDLLLDDFWNEIY